MWRVMKTMPLGHKYWLKSVDGFVIELSWDGLYNNATIFGPQKDAIEHQKMAKEKWPKDNISMEPYLPV